MAVLVVGAPLAWWRSRQSGGDASVRVALDRAKARKELDRLASADSRPAVAPEIQPSTSAMSNRASAGATTEGFPEDKSKRADEAKPLALAKVAEENSSDIKKFAEVAVPAAPPADNSKSTAADTETRAEEQTHLLAEQRERSGFGTGKVDQPAAKSLPAPGADNSPALIADSGAFGLKRKAENFRQQFSQTSANQAFRRDVKLQQAANVLSNFQVEQDGRQIRVVDADGSTYTGKIERLGQNDARNLEKQNYTARSNRAAAAAPAKDSDETANDEFYFRATGYNGSLKRSLVFEGNYIIAASPQQKMKSRDGAASTTEEQTGARIVGTAKVHGEPPLPVEAVSVDAPAH